LHVCSEPGGDANLPTLEPARNGPREENDLVSAIYETALIYEYHETRYPASATVLAVRMQALPWYSSPRVGACPPAAVHSVG
jgi:hypothetical protein